MTEPFVREAASALERSGAFEPSGDGFAATITPFDARVSLAPAGGRVEYGILVRAPTLDAAVDGEVVAPVVQEGWFETFALRMEDLGAAMVAEPSAPAVDLDRIAGEVVVETAFATGIASQGVSDAKAVVQYVEGTYVEGIVPGYDYRDPVSGLLWRATDRDGGPGGTPL